jgi:hypothetical protein
MQCSALNHISTVDKLVASHGHGGWRIQFAKTSWVAFSRVAQVPVFGTWVMKSPFNF